MPVFHLATPAAWAEAQAAGAVTPASLAAEGFVHCSTDDQLEGTIARHFAGVDELVLLRLRDDLVDELRWEESRPGEVFPHLYRSIAVHEVAEAIAWRRGDPLP